MPDGAKPLVDRVTIAGERQDEDGGGIYYVDVIVRQASLLQSVAAFTRPEGADLVPAHAIVPPGTNFQQRRQENLRAMSRSQEIAAAVALRELGKDVVTKPEGTLITGVAPDGPAAGKLEAGQVIVGVDGKSVRTLDELRQGIGTRKPGAAVTLRIRDGDAVKTVELKTVESPNEPGRAIVGIQVEQSATVKLPVKVEIDLGGVGGPSAGLAFALDVVDELGDDIDGGLKVAATGEIELDGSVGPIGGIKQKTIGAKAAGIDVFLVPAGDNAAVARRNAHGLRIVAVESFQQALRKLATLTKKG